MRKLFFALVSAVVLFCAAYAAELDPLLRDGAGELWKMSGESVVRAVPDTFTWMDQAHSRLRFNARTSRKILSLFGKNVQEAIFDFRGGRVVSLSVSVYNRGDAGQMDQRKFNDLLDLFEKKLADYAATGSAPRKENPIIAGAKVSTLIWEGETFDVMLLWSSSGRKIPEYLKLELAKSGAASLRLRDRFKTDVGSEELAGNVRNDPNGDRYILLPMVDQGAKGYCVAATVERIVKYYGSEIDQHQIAQIAESDADRGTSILKILEALDRGANKLGIRCESYYQYEEMNTVSDVRKVVREYNNIARHVSTLVDIRVSSVKSPWLAACKVGEVYTVPVSHGEGKLIAPLSELEKMRRNGQIATQYCDCSGRPTMVSPYNPNGSMWAIEGITSPDGRVFGKMGHSERTGENLYKNCSGNFDMRIFESGVRYFK